MDQANSKYEMEYPKFSPGDTVRTVYGEIRTVLRQDGCQVWVEEESNSHYHPRKIWKIKN